MSGKIYTRRSNQHSVPCQEILNIFTQKQNNFLSLLPQSIRLTLPTTRKISCSFILNMKQLLPSEINKNTLQQIQDHAKRQQEQFSKILNENIDSDKILCFNKEKKFQGCQDEVEVHSPPLRKKISKQCNALASGKDQAYFKPTRIFDDDKVVDKLEDYLNLD